MQKVPPVFIDRGIPVEYELVRSICTVSQQKRKKLGVLNTDAQLYGSFNMQTMSPSPQLADHRRVGEAVRRGARSIPASRSPRSTTCCWPCSPRRWARRRWTTSWRRCASGQPTAIFEDPVPGVRRRRAGHQHAAAAAGRHEPDDGGMQPPPKGDISKLWHLLGVDFVADQIIWQDYNPYPKASQFPEPEFVFVDNGCGAKEPFNPNDPISFRAAAGALPLPGCDRQAERLGPEVHAAGDDRREDRHGRFSDMMQMTPFGPRGGLNPNRRRIPTSSPTSWPPTSRARCKLRRRPTRPTKKDEKGKKAEPTKPASRRSTSCVVADIDMLSQDFFRLREQGDMPEVGIHFDFDNVTFVLNVLDELAGDHRFIEIRKRRPKHRTLARIEERTKEAKQEAADAREQFTKDYEDAGAARAEGDRRQDRRIEEAEERRSRSRWLIEVAMMQQDLERQQEAKLEQLRREKDAEDQQDRDRWR